MTRNRWLIVLALAAACGRSPAAPDVERERTPTRPAVVTPVAVTESADAAPDTERGFRALAEAVAVRSNCRILAWGTAPIADDDEPRRFAVLDPEEPGKGRGAYLVEDHASARWIVSFSVDGQTSPWAYEPTATRGSDPAWQERGDRAITHAQSHRHGGEELTFALRAGALVVLQHDYTGDAETEVTERRRFADEGVCARPCPALRDFATDDMDVQVIGPAASLDALIGGGS